MQNFFLNAIIIELWINRIQIKVILDVYCMKSFQGDKAFSGRQSPYGSKSRSSVGWCSRCCLGAHKSNGNAATGRYYVVNWLSTFLFSWSFLHLSWKLSSQCSTYFINQGNLIIYHWNLSKMFENIRLKYNIPVYSKM